jgi:hypothetical protein
MKQAPFFFPRPLRLALLIDAENMSWTCCEPVMKLAAERGHLLIRRAYADWTNPHVASWRKVLEANVIRPVQQFHYRHGKNASDSALIMDMMEMLLAPQRKVDGFCIVSSDSDYTGVVTRAREADVPVYGFGRQDAAKSFVAACNGFAFLDHGADDRHDAARSPSASYSDPPAQFS